MLLLALQFCERHCAGGTADSQIYVDFVVSLITELVDI